MAKSNLYIPSPLETYSSYLKKFGIQESRRLVYELFLNQYFKPLPNDKNAIAYTYKGLIPGRTFTYEYDPKYKDVLDFYDKRPVMLCIKEYIHPNTKNYLQLGVNLNFIPQEIRIFILNKLYEVYRKYIEFDIQKRGAGKVGRIYPMFTDTYDYYQILNYLLNRLMNSQYQFAIRLYIWDRMSNVKLIDFDEWGYIPLIETKDVVGLSVPEIHHLYWEYKRKQQSKYPLGKPIKDNRGRLVSKKYVMEKKLIEQRKKRKIRMKKK